MRPGDLRRFRDNHRRYPGETLLVLEVESMDTKWTSQITSVTFLVNGKREFGWCGELLEHTSEAINEAR
jgi:hypothetical protein